MRRPLQPNPHHLGAIVFVPCREYTAGEPYSPNNTVWSEYVKDIRDKTAASIGDFKRPYRFAITHQSDISELSLQRGLKGPRLPTFTMRRLYNILKELVLQKERPRP